MPTTNSAGGSLTGPYPQIEPVAQAGKLAPGMCDHVILIRGCASAGMGL